MRSLNTKIKADFIRKETSVSGSASSSDGLASHFMNDLQDERPKTGERSRTDDASKASAGVDKTESSNKARPRSLTFTRSKESVPTRKAGPTSHSRTKSNDNTSSGAAQVFSFVNRVPKSAAPEDYISYLHKVQKPQLIEVARIQKLRQLLRNEAVSWVDAFITQGGMAAVVNLLYRIIEVEWRYVQMMMALEYLEVLKLTELQRRARRHPFTRNAVMPKSLMYDIASSSGASQYSLYPFPYAAWHAFRQGEERT